MKKLAPKAFEAKENRVVGDGDGRTNGTVVNLSKNKKSRILTSMLNIRAIRKSKFLTCNTKKIFNHLQLAFIKALILQHFDLESYIWLEIDASGYAIRGMLSQLNLDSNTPEND